MWALLALAMVLPALLGAEEFYDSRYDEFDVGPLIENDRILISYAKCFLDQGPCTPEGKDFKKRIVEGLETTCAKCSPKQKELIKKVVNAIETRHPELWAELMKKYDPKDKYRSTFEQFLKD